jgi:hypothetical protein
MANFPNFARAAGAGFQVAGCTSLAKMANFPNFARRILAIFGAG